MAELRTVDPRTLVPNPTNPRHTAVPQAMDDQLVASILAIGLLQPPRVRDNDGTLVVTAGDRRTKACIAAGLRTIAVYVVDGDETTDAMASMSENLIRAGMNPVDTWRGIQKLEAQGWNDEGIGNALALPVRTIRKLKLLGSLHPPMLDCMAKGSMPNEDQLRTIANATLGEQAQVWKAHKPKKGHDVCWWEVSRALSKRRVPFSAARFEDALAADYGVVWVEDLFEQGGTENRFTTNVDGFFGAQRAWVEKNLPENGTLVPHDEYGRPELPKGATQIHSKPTKADRIGHYVDPRSGEVKTVVYRPALPAKLSKAKDGHSLHAGSAEEEGVVVKTRPDLTQKGVAMVGDYQTDALHQALESETIPSETLIGLLVLALAGDNVTVQTGLAYGAEDRHSVRKRLTEGGVLTADHSLLHSAARDMLRIVLSCRANTTNSGVSAQVAADALNASDHLPTMATDEFLQCLSRQALERGAVAEGLKVNTKVKDTRAAMVTRFEGATWRFPGAHFNVYGRRTPTEGQPSITGPNPDDDAHVSADNASTDADTPDSSADGGATASPYQVAAE